MVFDLTLDECGNARGERLEREIEAQECLFEAMVESGNLDRLQHLRNQMYQLRESLRKSRIEMAAARAIPRTKPDTHPRAP